MVSSGTKLEVIILQISYKYIFNMTKESFLQNIISWKIISIISGQFPSPWKLWQIKFVNTNIEDKERRYFTVDFPLEFGPWRSIAYDKDLVAFQVAVFSPKPNYRPTFTVVFSHVRRFHLNMFSSHLVTCSWCFQKNIPVVKLVRSSFVTSLAPRCE